MPRKLTLNEFIDKATKRHGDRYDYSKVEYINALTKISIICEKHGEFRQKPYRHLEGRGCPNCSRGFKLTRQIFIARANKIHNNKYDYSKAIYVNTYINIIVICKKHGKFNQTPKNHLKGQGCPTCGSMLRAITRTNSIEQFIQKARKVHGGKYDYSKVNYVNSVTKIIIICSDHGEFIQIPSSHINGVGCPSCGGSLKNTNEIFIQKSQEVHGNKYDYSKVNYINAHTKVIIICPKHGEFKQTPDSHIHGHGCHICATPKSEIFTREWLQKNSIRFEHQYNKCINPKTGYYLPYDFFIPSMNLLLELDGVFHYKQIHDSHCLRKTKLYDRYKTMWAHKNGYNLIRISYEENLKERLEQIFKNETRT